MRKSGEICHNVEVFKIINTVLQPKDVSLNTLSGPAERQKLIESIDWHETYQ